jgi:hypothetical protein
MNGMNQTMMIICYNNKLQYEIDSGSKKFTKVVIVLNRPACLHLLLLVVIFIL